MQITNSQFDGILLIKPDVFSDSRGFFYESFHAQRFLQSGLLTNFVQDNFSRSTKNTIRGLHYQVGNNAQGKLCQVIAGKVLDVAVDIRFGSPTFGKYFSIELSDDNHYQVFIPLGFAHGFSVLSDFAIFHYKCTAYYKKNDEKTILYSDETLNIDWKIDNPLVSEKDLSAKKFTEIEKDFIYK